MERRVGSPPVALYAFADHPGGNVHARELEASFPTGRHHHARPAAHIEQRAAGVGFDGSQDELLSRPEKIGAPGAALIALRVGGGFPVKSADQINVVLPRT
jgi:hypothetical protein